MTPELILGMTFARRAPMPLRPLSFLLPLACIAALAQPGPAPRAALDESTLKPVMGYRFVVRGRFADRDHVVTLTEHFLDGRTRRESPKFYENLDYDALVDLTCRKEPVAMLSSGDPSVKPLVLQEHGQILGFSLVRNEGDLDGDGRDELSYVADYADWSALNECRIVGYRRGRWKELASFPIHETWLPSLPQFQPQFWLFGVAGLHSSVGDARANRRLEAQLKAFPGFIRTRSPGRIRVRAYECEMGDTVWRTIRLKR